MNLKQTIKSINKEEWRFIVLVIFFVVLFTSLPYIYGYLAAPENTYSLAVSSLNRFDYPNYFSYIEQVKSGHFLFQDLYTTEPQPRIIFNLFFLILGLIAKAFNLSAVIIFQLSRIILIPIFLFILYVFISFLFKEKLKRKICLTLVCFSSGLGFWFLPWLSNLPLLRQSMDLWVPEAITFLTLYTNPLFTFSLTLIISIFGLMLLGLKNRNCKYAITAGILGLVLFQVHPYHIPTIFLIFGLFWLVLFLKEKRINWHFFKCYLIFALISLPSILYYFWLSTTHWLTAHRITQAIPDGLSPPFFSLIISYGLLWPLTLAGVYFIIKNKKLNNSFTFLITWLGSQTFLIYSPLPLQRKMSEGLHIVICFLASLGIYALYQKIKRRPVWLKNKFLWIIIFISLFCFSNIFILAKDSAYSTHPYFSIPQEIMEAMSWLKKISLKESIVLNNYNPLTANLIPGFAERKVYAGHKYETAYAETKIKEVLWFFKTNNHDKNKQVFLKTNKIDYIFFYKENENIFQPQEKKYLKRVFKNKRANIYQTIL